MPFWEGRIRKLDAIEPISFQRQKFLQAILVSWSGMRRDIRLARHKTATATTDTLKQRTTAKRHSSCTTQNNHSHHWHSETADHSEETFVLHDTRQPPLTECQTAVHSSEEHTFPLVHNKFSRNKLDLLSAQDLRLFYYFIREIRHSSRCTYITRNKHCKLHFTFNS